MKINELPEIETVNPNDYLIIYDSTNNITGKIKASNLNIGSSSGGGNSGTPLTYQSNGDSNGLFYYLGTNKNTSSWQNPSGSSVITSASSVLSGSPSQLLDRQDSQFYTDNYNGSFVQFQLSTGKLKCNHYSLKTRNASSDFYPRNWQLLGSNNGTDWDIVDEKTNNQSLTANSQWASFAVTSNTAYSYFRFANGLNSSGYYHLVLGEIEFYGEFLAN